MQNKFRLLFDKGFTGITCFSVILLVLTLFVILVPMLYKGSKAVLFKGTVEFRRLQMDEFNRGNKEKLQRELENLAEQRDFIYGMLDEFKAGIDTEALTDQVRKLYRDYGDELSAKNTDKDNYREFRNHAKVVRDTLTKAFEADTKEDSFRYLDEVDKHNGAKEFESRIAKEFFVLSKKYRNSIKNIDLAKRETYKDKILELDFYIRELFGPRPEDDIKPLLKDRYGATRWDKAEELLSDIKWITAWESKNGSKKLSVVKYPRKAEFAGTPIEEVFDYIENNTQTALSPKRTFYWQYWIDGPVGGYYFGGVGPHLLGTLILTILSMLFAVPLGIISAAYLIECAEDNFVIKIIRMSINSLAGVPSIVFGLFGLAFFVKWSPGSINRFGEFLASKGIISHSWNFKSEPCIFTASLTLALLTLPVIIRASEEAIKSVPQTYKEASLGLGAGKFSTFIKVTLPAALPGILTGIILSLSRVAGETAPILFTGAVASSSSLPKSIFSPTRTLSYGSYDIAVGDTIGMEVPHNQYGMVVTLVLLILLLNAAAIIVRSKVSARLKGH